ncbi:MAG TPA: hypothetical protein VKM72_20645 [Thermoanaerobaculia bacterium]|nr:hypothetical protein [Thermoanaerobaculia bacterium]
MGVFSEERGLELYLSESKQLSPFVPPLCSREPLTGVLRPRNFAILLFGRETQRFIPGAVSLKYLAKRCRTTATSPDLPSATKRLAWREFHAYLARAERELREALELSVDPGLTEQIKRNLDFLDRLRRANQPRRGSRR